MSFETKALRPFALLIGLQVLDVIVRVATQQIAPIRITSNMVISLVAIACVFVAGSISRLAIVLAGAACLILNLAFLAHHGLVNPSTNAPRPALFVFVIGSSALLNWLRVRRG